jgi:nucleotide-binding universal stress UspA family protein
MKKIEKVLAPTDLSELSALGLRYALELARGWGAEVTVYHIADGAELASYKAFSLEDLVAKHIKALSEFLQQHCADLLPLVEVREKVEVGEPAASILAEAEKRRQRSDRDVHSWKNRPRSSPDGQRHRRSRTQCGLPGFFCPRAQEMTSLVNILR